MYIITFAFVFSMHLQCKTLNNIIARLMQEITVHTRLATGVSKEAINLDYIKPLRDAIVRPLVVDGPEGVRCSGERYESLSFTQVNSSYKFVKQKVARLELDLQTFTLCLLTGKIWIL